MSSDGEHQRPMRLYIFIGVLALLGISLIGTLVSPGQECVKGDVPDHDIEALLDYYEFYYCFSKGVSPAFKVPLLVRHLPPAPASSHFSLFTLDRSSG